MSARKPWQSFMFFFRGTMGYQQISPKLRSSLDHWSPMVPSHDLSRFSRPASACCCCMHCGCLRPRLVDSLLGGRDEMLNQWVHAKLDMLGMGRNHQVSAVETKCCWNLMVSLYMNETKSPAVRELRIYMGSRGITKFLIKLIVKKAERQRWRVYPNVYVPYCAMVKSS